MNVCVWRVFIELCNLCDCVVAMRHVVDFPVIDFMHFVFSSIES